MVSNDQAPLSIVTSVSGRVLTLLRTSIRNILDRWGTGAVVATALAAAAVILMRTRRPAGTRQRRRSARRGSRRSSGLAGVQRVTLGMEVGGGVLDDAGNVRAEMVSVLKKFANLFELYLVVRVDNDESEDKISASFRNADVTGFDIRKLVFCDTVDGRVSIVRQIEPHLHIDETESVVTKLQRFIKHVAIVSEAPVTVPSSSSSTILKYSSLSQLL